MPRASVKNYAYRLAGSVPGRVRADTRPPASFATAVAAASAAVVTLNLPGRHRPSGVVVDDRFDDFLDEDGEAAGDGGDDTARAGLRRADVILEVNGRSIRSLADLDQALRGLSAGSRLVVLLQRGASSLFVTFTP